MKVLHIITGLGVGGAETMLLKVLTHLDRNEFGGEVMSLVGRGPMAEKLSAIDVNVSTLDLARSVPSPRELLALSRAIRRAKPDLVQTWMYHADLLGGICSRLATSAPVVWNVRASRLDVAGVSRRTRASVRLCAAMSRVVPSRIICGSRAAAEEHERLGYAHGKIVVIPNGFEVNQSVASTRDDVRDELGLGRQALLVGLVARFDPLKDHAMFIAAAGATARIVPDVHFILCGEGVVPSNGVLAQAIAATGVPGRFHLLGRRDDVARLNAAFDVAALSSYTEGFPNTIGEAMTAGVPCVVTDVGDSALIVGDTGLVVPPRDVDAFAAALARMLTLPLTERHRLGAAARQRVRDHYSISRITAMYAELYRSLARH